MIGLDIDNTLAQTTGTLLRRLNAEFGTMYKVDQVTQWSIADALGLPPEQRSYVEIVFRDSLFYRGLAPIPESRTGAHGFARVWPIVYISSRPSHLYAMTVDWLRDNDFPVGNVILTEDKSRAARENNLRYFVDDSLEHAQTVRSHCPVFLLDYPWNRAPRTRGIIRARTWKDITLYG